MPFLRAVQGEHIAANAPGCFRRTPCRQLLIRVGVCFTLALFCNSVLRCWHRVEEPEFSLPNSVNANSQLSSSQVKSVQPMSLANVADWEAPRHGWKVISACQQHLRVLYFVYTAPQHQERRRFLRETIGDSRVASFVNSSLIFFVGKTADNELQHRLEAEAEREGDLVQLDFVDVYRNLTLKFIGATQWLSKHGCLNSSARFVVKLDDDIIINVVRLDGYIRDLSTAPIAVSRNIYGARLRNLRPDRDNTSKWFVSTEEYPGDSYPVCCSGTAFLMRAPVLEALINASAHVSFFPLEDVYATGFLRQAANVSLVDIWYYCDLFPSKNTWIVRQRTLFLHLGWQPILFNRSQQLWQSVMNRVVTAWRIPALGI
ncbi:beta-1,3-galactosyltransferase 5-like [Haemaphysalis longicornis]